MSAAERIVPKVRLPSRLNESLHSAIGPNPYTSLAPLEVMNVDVTAPRKLPLARHVSCDAQVRWKMKGLVVIHEVIDSFSLQA
jgi:hypothetical protein